MSLFAAKIQNLQSRFTRAMAEFAQLLDTAFGAPQVDHRAILVPVREERPQRQPR
ncbi:MAG: hypothetical protein ACU0A6_06525 [Shimia sp.]|jgi:hypothetical protein|uniref:hypothetical protein n=1 Tax=Shimia sp. TaxID=1954381 RepID=UPI004058E169